MVIGSFPGCFLSSTSQQQTYSSIKKKKKVLLIEAATLTCFYFTVLSDIKDLLECLRASLGEMPVSTPDLLGISNLIFRSTWVVHVHIKVWETLQQMVSKGIY